MKLLRIIGMGLSGLVGRPFRTGLAALGIVIGVASVVALTSLGNGIRESVSGQITDLGPNIVTVSPGSESGDGGGAIDAEIASTLTPNDAKDVAALPSVKAASPNVATSALVGGKSVLLSGVDPSYDEVRNVELAAGRFVENDREVVLSQADAKRLLGSKPEGAVGETVALSGPRSVSQDAAQSSPQGGPRGASQTAPRGASNGPTQQLPQGIPPQQAQRPQNAQQDAQQSPQQPAAPAETYEVVGVAASQPGSGLVQAASAVSYVSTADALELSGSNTVGQILVSAAGAGAVDEAKAGITSAIRSNHGGQKDFTVETQEDLVSTFTEITDQLNVFLAGIAGISLLVGGIGVMNIMLVSVAERTREIGLRKALGATDSDVLLQFLFEAVLLAALGGLAGVALGVGASSLLPVVLPTLPAPVFGTTQIALAFGVSAAIGVLFGSLPAYRSARLTPVEALRRE